jgi:sugar lactone lactonase YvrE
MFRPKAVSVDSEGDLYIADALWGVVQVFNRQGQLLYYFGSKGTHAGEFQLPAGLFIDRDDRLFVVDSYNRRIQVFQYVGAKNAANHPGDQQQSPGTPANHPSDQQQSPGTPAKEALQ